MTDLTNDLNKVKSEYSELKKGIDNLLLPFINKPLVEEMINKSSINDDKDFKICTKNTLQLFSKLDKLSSNTSTTDQPALNSSLNHMNKVFSLVNFLLTSLDFNSVSNKNRNAQEIDSTFDLLNDHLNKSNFVSKSEVNNTDKEQEYINKLSEYNRLSNKNPLKHISYSHNTNNNSKIKNNNNCNGSIISFSDSKFINMPSISIKNPYSNSNNNSNQIIHGNNINSNTINFNYYTSSDNNFNKIKDEYKPTENILKSSRYIGNKRNCNLRPSIHLIKNNPANHTSCFSAYKNKSLFSNSNSNPNRIKFKSTKIKLNENNLNNQDSNNSEQNNDRTNITNIKNAEKLIRNNNDNELYQNNNNNNNTNLSYNTYSNSNNFSNKLNYRSDCIRKRIKTFINNYILNKLNDLVKHYDNKIFFLKLPKELIVNIKIKFNNNLLNKSIKELFSTMVEDPKEISRIEHNKKVINQIDDPVFKAYASKLYKEIFVEYTRSSQYLQDIMTLSKRENKEYLQIYQQHVNGFLDYFDVTL